jgi:hypothetical protein
MPKQRGKATRKTTSEAGKSALGTNELIFI